MSPNTNFKGNKIINSHFFYLVNVSTDKRTACADCSRTELGAVLT